MKITINNDLAGKAEHYIKRLHDTQRVEWVLLNDGQIVEIGTKDERVRPRLDSEGFPKLTKRDVEAGRVRLSTAERMPF